MRIIYNTCASFTSFIYLKNANGENGQNAKCISVQTPGVSEEYRIPHLRRKGHKAQTHYPRPRCPATHLFNHLLYLNMKTTFAVLALVAGASAFNGKSSRRFEFFVLAYVCLLLKMVLFWIVGVAIRWLLPAFRSEGTILP